MLPLIYRYVIDNILGVDIPYDEKVSKLMWVMGIALFVFLILRPPIEYYRQYLAQEVSSKILYDIRDTLFDHIQN